MRVKSIAARKHRKVKKLAKGFRQARRQRVKAAKEALVHAGAYAYHGRKLRKRDFRGLWIIRINAAIRAEGMSYSKFMARLKKANIQIDRKILADIATNDPSTFKAILSQVK
ncbi:MAG: 50S ribosomal protein L20 [Patescibacteria group bacterium]